MATTSEFTDEIYNTVKDPGVNSLEEQPIEDLSNEYVSTKRDVLQSLPVASTMMIDHDQSSSANPNYSPYIFPFSSKINAPKARYIEHHITMPEWPSTHEEGVLHVINLQHRTLDIDLKSWHSDIQYGKSSGNYSTSTSHFLSQFFNQSVTLYVSHFKCTGCRICPFASDEFKTLHHTRVDWTKISNFRRIIRERSQILNQQIPFKQETEAEIAVMRIHYNRSPCGSVCRQGLKLKLPPIATTQTPKVYCPNYSSIRSNSQAAHFIRNFPKSAKINLEYLQRLLSPQISHLPENECPGVYALIGRKDYCNFTHASSNRRLIHLKCDSVFQYGIPQDIQRFPYVLLYTRGIHTHPFPCFHRTPQMIRKDLQKIVQNLVGEGLSLGQIRQHSLTLAWVREQGGDTLSNIHPSLTNELRLRAILLRERLTSFPLGQDVEAIKFRFQTACVRQSHDTYIQGIDEDDTFIAICCFSQEQALLLSSCSSIQMDASFKRIRGFIELILAYKDNLDGSQSMTITLARLFLNQESEKAYYRAFHLLNRCLYAVCGHGLYFRHIHNRGLSTITVDMDTKQASGFGRFLVDIDPKHTWQIHIMHIFIYCLIHYERGITQKYSQHPFKKEMQAMPYYCDQMHIAQWDTAISQFPDLQNWAKHKQYSWVRSGLLQHFSFIPINEWNRADRTSNIIESTHEKSYVASGRYCSLLRGINHAEILDRRDTDRRRQALEGVQLSYNDTSPIGLRRRRDARHDATNLSLNDSPIPFSLSFSSSGVPSSTLRTPSINQSAQQNSVPGEKRARSVTQSNPNAPKRSRSTVSTRIQQIEHEQQINQILSERIRLEEHLSQIRERNSQQSETVDLPIRQQHPNI